MNCQSPFPHDDPFLPQQDAPVGPCLQCGQVHRLDFGCGESVAPIVWWIAVGFAALFVVLATAALVA
jgi:hypothetical protein